jgi:hypothetical protein
MTPVLRSRLLARLEAQISASRHPIETACLRAERAGFLARQGHLQEAHKEIAELQTRFAIHPNAAVSAWLHLADGLHDYFSDFGAAALDKIQRAHALAAAAGLKPLQALSAAWLAQLQFGAREDDRAAASAAEALKLAAPDDHSTRSRVGILLARAYHVAGRPDLAQPWYQSARQHAVADGDDAALSALLQNQSWLRGHQVRLAELFGELPNDDSRQALMIAESTGHFDAGVGAASLGSLVPMLRAQLLVVQCRFGEALALLRDHLDAAEKDGLGRLRASFLADIAWCECRLGAPDDARRDADEAVRRLDAVSDVDDRALAQGRIAQVCAALGDDARAAQYREAAQRDYETHRAEQQRIVELMDAAVASARG